MITVLITGTEPFESDPTNPSWDITQAPNSTQVDDAVIVAQQLSCVFGLTNEILADAIEATSPALVFTLGPATGQTETSVERVAINVIDVRIPNSTDNQPVDTLMVTGRPTAYFSTLPTKVIVRALREAGVLAGVSQSAGTYSCSHLFYSLMHHIATRASQVRGGFVHALTTPELAARHAGRPSPSIDTQIKGIRLAVRIALAMQSDLKVNADAVH